MFLELLIDRDDHPDEADLTLFRLLAFLDRPDGIYPDIDIVFELQPAGAVIDFKDG